MIWNSLIVTSSMKQVLTLTILSVVLIFTSGAAFGQSVEEMNQGRTAERQAIADYRAKNFAGFLENMKKASDLRPNHSRLIYNLAIAYVLNDRPKEALSLLDQLAEMGLTFRIGNDDDFKPLFADAKFEEIRKRMELNRQPINASQKAFSIDQKDLIAEGVAYNPKTRTFYLSSIHKRKIVAVSADGKTRDFSAETDGLWSVSGMRIDVKRQILWACSSVFPQMKGFAKEDDGRAGIFKYDLKSGKLLKKYLLSNEAEKHALGDLVLTDNGDVFATDSVSPNIYFLDQKSDKLELFVKSDLFSSLQGPALTPDGKHLFVADYGKGIFRIETATKKITQLKPAAKVTLLGLDGLYYHDGKLIGIQNGINPQRVASFSLNPQATEITGFTALETNHPDFNEPTLGTIIGDELFFVANSQWELVSEKAELQTEKLRNPVVLKLKL